MLNTYKMTLEKFYFHQIFEIAQKCESGGIFIFFIVTIEINDEKEVFIILYSILQDIM